MPQYIAGEKIKKWSVVRLDDDWITLHNLLKTKAQKQDERSGIIFWIFFFIIIVLYIVWAVRINNINTGEAFDNIICELSGTTILFYKNIQ
jgi:hypothetical protein